MRNKRRQTQRPTKRFTRQVRGQETKRSFILDRTVGNKAEAEVRAKGWRRMGYLARVVKKGYRQYSIYVVRR